MSTLVASESSHLVEPGVPFHKLDGGFSVAHETSDIESSQAHASQAPSPPEPRDGRRREESWVCEWWPPTE